MKASEVTESGFYWWNRPVSHGNGFDGFPGWQPVLIKVSAERVDAWLMGSEFYWEGDDLDGDLLGPITPQMVCPIPGEALTDRLLGKGEGNET